MKKKHYYMDLVLSLFVLINSSIAQDVTLTGKVINPDEKPIKNVLIYLGSNPTLYCHSDSLGNFSLTNISTSVPEVKQNEIISFENRKLLLYANNKPVSVDVITINGIEIMNILNLNKHVGTIGLYPEAYISNLPKAIYIVRAKVGNTFQSYKIQNIIPSGFPQGIIEYDINNTIEKSFTEPKSEPIIETKSEALDTLVLVHDFYRSRKIPISSYSIQYDTIHLNNFADYSIAEGFEPSVTYLYNGYANFTNILSVDSVQFIIDYDTLSILKGDLKVITIPVDKIEGLDNSIEFISGLHFEPSGTHFLQPVQVSVLMKDSIPENLVVFQCNDKGETYFIPYESHEFTRGDYFIRFIINHFSSIGLGTSNIPTKSDPSEFTTSDQFISYLAQFVDNFDAVPDGIYTIWFNNVVAPMISKIITLEDFEAPLSEFGIIGRSFLLMGGEVFETLPFYGSAMGMFSEKMMNLWNACVVEYNRLEDKCLKRAILKIASKIITLNQLLGDICADITLSNFNDLCKGEVYKLTNKIEFSTPVKHLEVGGSYTVQYTLKSITNDVASIPEDVIWSSSNPSVATIDANAKIIALKDGVTTIKGKICDIENTFEVEVGGYNCETNYCLNKYESCYSGTYKCTGVAIGTSNEPGTNCPFTSWKDRYTLVGDITHNRNGYLETLSLVEFDTYNPVTKKCERHYSYQTYYDTRYFYCNYTGSNQNHFHNRPSAGGMPPFFDGYLYGNSLTLVSHTTTLHCIRIDK